MITKDIADAPQPTAGQTLLVVDGNAVFHSLTEIPDTFRGTCEKVFSMIPGTADVLFSTDMYKTNSVKSLECQLRGCGEKLLLSGPSMRRPPDWKGFLRNSENKQQFTNILLRVWSENDFASHLKNRQVIKINFNYICGSILLFLSGDCDIRRYSHQVDCKK